MAFPDIAAALNNNSFFSVFINNGDKTFEGARTSKTGRGPVFIESFDANGDDYPDLLTSNSASQDVSVLLNIVSPSLSEPRVFTYDTTFSQLTSVTDELGRETLFAIDPSNGNRLQSTRVVGQRDTISSEIDDIVESSTYTARGQIETATDPLNRVTRYEYDQFARLTTVTFAEGTVDEASQHFEYDVAGNRTASVDENGNRTVYEYDNLSRLTRIVEADPDGIGPLSSPITQLDFDSMGNLARTTDAEDNETTNVYDQLDRLIRTRDALGNTTTFEYDNDGNVVRATNPLGHAIHTRYDSRDRQIELIDADGGRTMFRYDFDNNLTRVVDPVHNSTRFAYDVRDRLIRETDPLDNTIAFRYDAVDNLIQKTDRNSRITDLVYDDLDRLDFETWLNSDESTANIIDYVYDKASNLQSIADNFSALNLHPRFP